MLFRKAKIVILLLNKHSDVIGTRLLYSFEHINADDIRRPLKNKE